MILQPIACPFPLLLLSTYTALLKGNVLGKSFFLGSHDISKVQKGWKLQSAFGFHEPLESPFSHALNAQQIGQSLVLE